MPFDGGTAPQLEKWRWLAELGRCDLVVARLAEGHLDAAGILAEAGRVLRDGAFYGVWASASGGTGLRAQRQGDSWQLNGTLRFCTGARCLDRALVTARTDDGELLLLDVDLRDAGWQPVEGTWPAVGMDLSDSLDVEVRASVPASARSAQRGSTSTVRDSPSAASAWPPSGSAAPPECWTRSPTVSAVSSRMIISWRSWAPCTPRFSRRTP